MVQPRLSPECLLGRDRSPSGPHRRRGAVGDIALPQSSPENTNPVVQPRLSPEYLPGRDRSPSGPEPQTLALSEKSPYPQSSPENTNPVVQPQLSPECLLGRDRSPSGPAPQTRRFRRNRPTPRAPLRTPTPWCNPSYHPKTSPVGTDLRAVRTADIGAFGEIALTPEASHWVNRACARRLRCFHRPPITSQSVVSFQLHRSD